MRRPPGRGQRPPFRPQPRRFQPSTRPRVPPSRSKQAGRLAAEDDDDYADNDDDDDDIPAREMGQSVALYTVCTKCLAEKAQAAGGVPLG